MTRKQFKQNLVEAFEFHDVDLQDEEVDKLVNYNFDESGETAGWTFANFNSFALDVATEGLRRACKFSDLYYESNDEDDE
jgi:hypothetical protein